MNARNYRQMGLACTPARVPLAEMVDALDGAAEAVRDELMVVAAGAMEADVGMDAVDRAITAHCKLIDDFAREAYRILEAAVAELGIERLGGVSPASPQVG